MQQSHSLDSWSDHIRKIAQPHAGKGDTLSAGVLDEPFRLVVCDQKPGCSPQPTPQREIGLWWALVDRAVDVDGLLESPTKGSLFQQGMYKAIEVWTDADLCGLHALWTLARKRERTDWMKRVEGVRDWHLEHTQPDNATNRPWALHVFLLGQTPECNHYAETLLHNCLALRGFPDPLSAWILIDAANRLDTYLAESPV